MFDPTTASMPSNCLHIQIFDQTEPALEDRAADIQVGLAVIQRLPPTRLKRSNGPIDLSHVAPHIALKILNADMDQNVHAFKRNVSQNRERQRIELVRV